MRTGPFSFGTIILGGGALLLGLFLALGFALPGTWTAEGERLIRAPAHVVYPLLDSPAGWRRWTPWPDRSLVESGPGRGVGASMSWDDLDIGNGTFTIVEASEPNRVAYRVVVQDSALVTTGTLTLTPTDAVTLVRWREDGDFGWNPLMGYWALFMNRVQSRQMAQNLDELARVAESAAPPEAPNASTPVGAPTR